MALFSEASLVKKLTDLNNSQQSIQTLSLWLIHHRKHSKAIVDVWLKEHKKARASKRLTFLYLANDIIQNSKKKGPEFRRDFKPTLAEAFRTSAKDFDEKTTGSVDRLLSVWKERGIYDAAYIDNLKRNLKSNGTASKNGSSRVARSSGVDVPSKSLTTPYVAAAATVTTTDTTAEAGGPQKKKRKVELLLHEEVDLDIANGASVEPPQSEDLAKMLLDLENSASSDAAVREKIAGFPPEVSDVSLLEKITDNAAATRLAKTVEEACSLLTNYNVRLASELQERRQIARLLREFILLQKNLLAEDEQKLQEYHAKLDKVAGVRKELASHLLSLPDIAYSSTASLAALPSAGDLFE